jgi:hypothetical protein
MTDQGRQIVEAVASLRSALDRTAQALVTANLDELMRSEGALELAVRSMPVPVGVPEDLRVQIREDVDRARRLLQRCRHYGDVLLDVVRLSLEAQGRTSGYGPRHVPVVPFAPRLDTKG